MATDVNGYDGYDQDTAAHIQEPPQESNLSSQSTQPKAAPQEIGWYFVEQYYTTMSKTPERIHLFYAKKSQLVLGDEAQKVLPAVGQKAISEKIKELGIENCKVRVLNVDSQSSLNNIVVQVIGELSNKGDPSRKFVQTFVLAEQPNGYFVLNDIFRYLNDYDDEVEDEPEPEPVLEEPTVETVPQVEKTHEVVADEEIAQTVDAKLEEVAEQEAPNLNGSEIKEPEAEAEAEPAPEPQPVKVDDPPVTAEIPPEPEPTPAQSPPKATPAAPVEAPPAKKTWANVIGSKASATPTPPPTVPAQPKAQKAPTPQVTAPQAPMDSIPSPASSGSGWQTADHGKKQNRPQQRTEQHLAYVKNVTNKVDEPLLRTALEKFGTLKYFDVSRSKNCAFVDFADAAGYQAAISANPLQVGTEQVLVEERRPRPGAFGNQGFNRGGSNVGRGRGGMAGRQGSHGGGYQKDVNRGGYQSRGGRGGNITPKGRSQVEAV